MVVEILMPSAQAEDQHDDQDDDEDGDDVHG
jgi:hypothetical protein